MWPFTRKSTPAAPVTCSEAGRLGAAVQKAQDREPIRAKTRQMYIERGLAVPAALEVLP